ncbi:hypothetical protein PSQ40_13960 [Curvibacter sp. HBC61]|uniref:Transmembrane protein n=1 Tax=Curvibacter cyanobacteriorum TaxID=3026422 RepID=A0ABT5N042_9BURK|nr:hypothetical protein [Curvibacter sp. HBC61]MDD0839686.1 hypothetical protein [Curvibacter sp. HBC61]
MSGSKLSDASTAPQTPKSAADAPLGLTVHTLPAADQLAASVAGPRTRLGRLKMLAVLAVCAAPVVASYFTYYVVRPTGQRNFGELIEPQRDLPPVVARTAEGQSLPLTSLKGQWLLISVAGGACDEACEQHLYLQRQLRESLGKDKDRMDWVWLINDDAPIKSSLLPALAQATLLRVPPDALAQWLSPASGHQLADHLYVVDPMGHWMMRFPARLDMAGAAKAKKDLERLMRASASWDEAGR